MLVASLLFLRVHTRRTSVARRVRYDAHGCTRDVCVCDCMRCVRVCVCVLVDVHEGAQASCMQAALQHHM